MFYSTNYIIEYFSSVFVSVVNMFDSLLPAASWDIVEL